jgi:hypothetical protein
VYSAPVRASLARRGVRKWPNYARTIALAPVSVSGKPDRSRADFAWCMTAIDWRWSIEDVAQHAAAAVASRRGRA